ncbi:hypothetical protein K2X92_05540 [Candidatus Gracilibacteria bacterium]|nr:hypothetical protein [Candidatus Gracilibacteria bacterium]
MTYIHGLVVLSAIISIGGAILYMRDTLRGKTKPNLISWSMWAIAPLIGTGAAIFAHADIWATVRIFLAGFIPLLVVIFSLTNKQSYWKLTFFDGLCGAFSLIALGLWLIVDLPQLAILFAVIGDGFAALPTIIKSWKNPETETGMTYIASFISVVIVLPSIPVWDIPNSAFQIYLLIINIILVSLVYRKYILCKLGFIIR